jgi:hypothetical protein
MLLPTYQSLITNYPGSSYTSAKVRELIKGEIQSHSPTFSNTCVIRMSRAFNYANSGTLFDIPESFTGMLTFKGEDKLNYAIRVSEFDKYLKQQYSKPTLVLKRKNGEFDLKQLNSIKGIIKFEVSGWDDATGHFTFWDGSSCVYCGDHDYFAMKQTSSISFWKC